MNVTGFVPMEPYFKNIDLEAVKILSLCISVFLGLFLVFAVGFYFILKKSNDEKAPRDIRDFEVIISLMALSSLFVFSLSSPISLRFENLFNRDYLVQNVSDIISILIFYFVFIAAMVSILYLYIKIFTPRLTEKPKYKSFWVILKNFIVSFLGVMLFFLFIVFAGWICRYYFKSPELIFIVLLGFALINYMFSPLYLRFFGKAKRITEGKIYEDFLELLEKAKISNLQLFSIDMENEIANGLVSGFFPQLGGVYLTQPLLKKLNENEIKAVVAHELGHIKKNHLFIRIVALSVWFVSLWFLYRTGNSHIVNQFVNIGFMLLFYFMRRMHEYQADVYAAELSDSEDMISALEKIHNVNREHQIIEAKSKFDELGCTHPLLNNRITNLKNLKEKAAK